MEQSPIFATLLTYWAYACLISTLLIRVVPTPDEIGHKGYTVFFNILQRFANSGFKDSTRKNGSINGKV